MNTKFTKGPWQRDKYGSVKGVNGESVMLHGFSLCCGYTPKDDPSYANTDVALAAPELYEALEEAADCINDLSRNKGGWDYERVIQDIAAILEKARGEA